LIAPEQSAMEPSPVTIEPDPEISGLRQSARLCRARGELEQALRIYEEALDLAAARGDAAELVAIATGLGNVQTDLGNWSEAERHYRSALEQALPLEDRRQTGQLWNNLSMVRRRIGDVSGALDFSNRAIALFEELGERDELARCYNHLGLAQVESGQHEAALQSLANAAELADDSYVLAAVHSNLCELSLRLESSRGGRAAHAGWAGLDAEQQASLGADLARTHGFHRILTDVYRELGTLCRLRRDRSGSRFFERALEIVRRHAYRHAEADVEREYGLFRLELGEPEEGHRRLLAALDLYRRVGASADVSRVERLLAQQGVAVGA
jgi:Tfp pilus assembly protein PilF